MPESIEGKKVVVTGGAGGIGSLVAAQIRTANAEVLIADRIQPADTSFGYLKADFSNARDISLIATELAAYCPDILINLAGMQYFGPVEEQNCYATHVSYMVNLVAPVLLTQAVLPAMKRRGSGQIVNIGSIFASINYPHFATYSSAKAGLRGFSEALRRELAGSGIDVTYIAPRAVKTGLNNDRVLRFAEMAKMKMDAPEVVARRIVQAIIAREKDVYIGLMERFYVLMNGILPRVFDKALAAETANARALFTS